jgi:UMF1 family MFS transporter
MTPNVEERRPPLKGQRLLSGLSILSKRSRRSCATSAFEADDERSSNDEYDHDDDYSMSSSGSEPGGLQRPPVPKHAGHDARPTSQKELMGWYSYAFAAETYVICGIGMFYCLHSRMPE